MATTGLKRNLIKKLYKKKEGVKKRNLVKTLFRKKPKSSEEYKLKKFYLYLLIEVQMIREIQALSLICPANSFIAQVLAIDSKSEWAKECFVPTMIEKLLKVLTLS